MTRWTVRSLLSLLSMATLTTLGSGCDEASDARRRADRGATAHRTAADTGADTGARRDGGWLAPAEAYAFLGEAGVVGDQPLSVSATETGAWSAAAVADTALSDLLTDLPPVQLDGALVVVEDTVLFQMRYALQADDAGDALQGTVGALLADAGLDLADVRAVQRFHNTVGFGGETYSYDALYVDTLDPDHGGLLLDGSLGLVFAQVAREGAAVAALRDHPAHLCAQDDDCLAALPADGVLLEEDGFTSVDPTFTPPGAGGDDEDEPVVAVGDDCSCTPHTYQRTGAVVFDADQTDHWLGLPHTDDGLVKPGTGGVSSRVGFDRLEGTPVLTCEVLENCDVKMTLQFTEVAATCDGFAVHGSMAAQGWIHVPSVVHTPARALDTSKCGPSTTTLIATANASVFRAKSAAYNWIIDVGHQLPVGQLYEAIYDLIDGLPEQSEGDISREPTLTLEAAMGC